MLKYKCIHICILHTIFTVTQTTQIGHLIKPECYSVYFINFPYVPPWGDNIQVSIQ